MLLLLLLLQERITELEAEAMGQRPWQLTGEVGAASRPLNSALEVSAVAVGRVPNMQGTAARSCGVTEGHEAG